MRNVELKKETPRVCAKLASELLEGAKQLNTGSRSGNAVRVLQALKLSTGAHSVAGIMLREIVGAWLKLLNLKKMEILND